MTYEEATEAIVTQDEARREIEKHGFTLAEFMADNGDQQEYFGQTVLDWLGY